MSSRSNTQYAPYASRQVQSSSLPQGNIECIRCHRKKPQTQFSNKQLEELRKAIKIRKANASKEAIVTCRFCMPGQTEELHCCICSETKSLDDFAKAQRSKPDQAECKICVTKRINTEPGEAGPPKAATAGTESSLVNYSDSDSDTTTSHPYDYSSTNKLGSSLNKISLNGKETNNNVAHAKPGWAVQDRASYNSSLKGYSTVPTTTASSRQVPGNNQNTQNNQPKSPAAAPASDGGFATASHRRGTSSTASRSAVSPPPKTSKGGWAKPSRGPSTIEELSAAGIDDDSDDDWGKEDNVTTVYDEDELP